LFKSLRRQIVNSVIGLANASAGGSWELVDVKEGPLVTTMTFELQRPYVEIVGGQREQTRRCGLVSITIATLTDDKANDQTQLLPIVEYNDGR
jgi:hypothetical protein